MSCQIGCYEADVQACEDIKLKAGLEANKQYYVILRKSGQSNPYQFLYTTDADGVITIDESVYPAGYFTKGNYIRIELREGVDYLTKVKLSFAETQYDCVLIRLVEFAVAEEDSSPINLVQ